MTFFGVLVAVILFCHFKRRVRWYSRLHQLGDEGPTWPQGSLHHRHRHRHRDEERETPDPLTRARRRAAAEAGFYGHLLSYLGVIAFLGLINLFTTRYPWFIWPALGWGIGLFSHYMAVFGSRLLRERFFDPAVERELGRQRATMQTEKQASIDELSSPSRTRSGTPSPRPRAWCSRWER